MIAQKVEDMLGKALASFLLLLLGAGAIEATSPEGEKVRQFHQPALPLTDGLSPRVIPKAGIFHSPSGATRPCFRSSAATRSCCRKHLPARKPRHLWSTQDFGAAATARLSSCRCGDVHKRGRLYTNSDTRRDAELWGCPTEKLFFFFPPPPPC